MNFCSFFVEHGLDYEHIYRFCSKQCSERVKWALLILTFFKSAVEKQLVKG